ncbi:MAG TPA: hypothetical protein VFX51_01990 [Solirubrobacteraceae bacterium]|nr:hypothetical protein [Solirubrobacteraceae bacterium]
MRRRDLFAAALAAGLAAPAAARGQDADSDVLRRLIAREDGAAFAYRGKVFPGLGDPAAQDEDHARALRTELQGLIEPGEPPLSPDDLDPAARRVNDASGDALRAAAIALETDLLATYREALLEIAEPAILQTAATILACHAQRRALLSYPP